MAKTLSPKMVEVLKAMHADPEKKVLAHSSTAYALCARGLAYFHEPIGSRQLTMGGNFPHYLIYLTDAGRIFCMKRFEKSGA